MTDVIMKIDKSLCNFSRVFENKKNNSTGIFSFLLSVSIAVTREAV